EYGVKCMENYHKSYNDKFRCYGDKPFHDWSSHCCLDPESLVSTPYGLVEIEKIKIGDYVFTPFGVKSVLWCGVTSQTDRLVELHTSYGNVLTCTVDHKIFVRDKGFTRCDELRYNDTLSSLK